MVAELEYFCAMVFYGVVMSCCYHILLFFRAIVHHGSSLVDAEDILFLMAAGFVFFLAVYEKNDGILRWYAYAGAGIGCIAYVRTLGATVDHGRKWLLKKRRKTVKIKPKFCSKEVPVDEGNSPEQAEKEKERS